LYIDCTVTFSLISCSKEGMTPSIDLVKLEGSLKLFILESSQVGEEVERALARFTPPKVGVR
jgi:hypothetical protein